MIIFFEKNKYVNTVIITPYVYTNTLHRNFLVLPPPPQVVDTMLTDGLFGPYHNVMQMVREELFRYAKYILLF